MTYDELIEKAKRLGINPDNNPNQTALQNIAEQLGLDPYECNVEDIIEAINIIEEDNQTNNDFDNRRFDENEDTNVTENQQQTKTNNINNPENVEKSETINTQRAQNRFNNPVENNYNSPSNRRLMNNVNAQNSIRKAAATPGNAVSGATSAATAGKAAAGAGTAATTAATTGAAAAGASTATAGGSAIVTFISSHPVALAIVAGIIVLLIIILLLFASQTTGGLGKSNAFCNKGCDGVSINQSSLSKSEFIEKVNDYYNNVGGNELKVFSDNAGDIYDIASSQGVNPELIVVRAILEGLSPAKDNNSNNYWGIACYNDGGMEACAKYSSFQDGVKAYVGLISSYGSVTEMMSKFAYLGSVWYYPGSWAIGGCMYYDSIKEFMSNERQRQVQQICSGTLSCTTAHESDCQPTNEEDQNAYDAWQVKRILEVRKQVFGLEPTECNKTCYEGDYSIDPNDELYTDLQLLTGRSLESLLTSNGMTVEEYEAMLKSEIEKAGVGTRSGVVAAATTLIGSLAEMGYKLNYDWSGNYWQLGVNKDFGAVRDTSHCTLYGSVFGDASYCIRNYKWSGFDCVGFVGWALRNGMQDTAVPNQNTVPTNTIPGAIQLDPNNAVCKPGGALVSSAHVVLVVGIDTEQKKYIVAETTGSDISKNTGGTKISYYDFDAKGYVCNNFNEMYGD